MCKGQHLLEEAGTKQQLFETSESLYRLYEQEERWLEALQSHEAYVRIRDEVKGEEAQRSLEQAEHLRRIEEHEKEIEIAKVMASAELNATTALLNKVLPQTVALRLIAGEEDIADSFPEISILFADIVGFTPLSSQMPASVVVRFLNFVFREFDGIVRKFGCEKIRTIGDGYMAVAGAPVPCDDHAERIARAALAMQQDIHLPEDIREYIDVVETQDSASLHVRIGIHTGSAVGGIIGDEPFVYDVHGDAVNLAARMESSGEPGRIHCSEELALHLRNREAVHGAHAVFRFEERGEIEIKGKGKMRTFFMEHGK